MARASLRKMTFSGVEAYTLTTSYVASDAQVVDFGKRITIYPVYTRGTGGGANTVQYTIELNPFDASTDTTGAYWFQYGIFLDSTGTWSQELATFTSGTGTALVAENLGMVILDQIDGYQIRIKAKETVAAGSAGTLNMMIMVNDPVNSH